MAAVVLAPGLPKPGVADALDIRALEEKFALWTTTHEIYKFPSFPVSCAAGRGKTRAANHTGCSEANLAFSNYIANSEQWVHM